MTNKKTKHFTTENLGIARSLIRFSIKNEATSAEVKKVLPVLTKVCTTGVGLMNDEEEEEQGGKPT